jgi:hypothetical protein
MPGTPAPQNCLARARQRWSANFVGNRRIISINRRGQSVPRRALALFDSQALSLCAMRSPRPSACAGSCPGFLLAFAIGFMNFVHLVSPLDGDGWMDGVGLAVFIWNRHSPVPTKKPPTHSMPTDAASARSRCGAGMG